MIERRKFLTMIGACATAGSAIACGGDDGGAAPATGKTTAGNTKDYPVNTVKALATASIIIGRDARGLYAMSSVCTHQQCDMRSQGKIAFAEIECSCHGSRFTSNGVVTEGPASSPLPHYTVTVAADGTISVDADKIVAADVRVAVA